MIDWIVWVLVMAALVGGWAWFHRSMPRWQEEERQMQVWIEFERGMRAILEAHARRQALLLDFARRMNEGMQAFARQMAALGPIFAAQVEPLRVLGEKLRDLPQTEE